MNYGVTFKFMNADPTINRYIHIQILNILSVMNILPRILY